MPARQWHAELHLQTTDGCLYLRTVYAVHRPRVLSRATSGIRGRTLIVNLPGSPKGVREALTVILPVLAHGLALLADTPTAHATRVQSTGG